MRNTPYICDYCDYQNFNKANLTGHMEVHLSRESLTQFKCEECERIFYRKRVLQRHERNVHGKSSSFACECGRDFKTQADLNHHRREAHKQQGFQCTDCDSHFKSRRGFRDHIAKNHKSKIFCEVCGELTAPGSSFKMHMMKHEDVNRCAVEGCGLNLKSEDDLKNHMNSVHGFDELKAPPGYKICPFCAKILSARAIYKHVSYNFCSISFPAFTKFLLQLRAHKNKLSNNFFQCDFCEYKTFNKLNIKAHMFKHKSKTSLKEIKCGSCDKIFYQRANMISHERNMHGDNKAEVRKFYLFQSFLKIS